MINVALQSATRSDFESLYSPSKKKTEIDFDEEQQTSPLYERIPSVSRLSLQKVVHSSPLELMTYSS
jgi:hypothetical protein